MSPGQRTMIENNLGVIRKVVLKYVGHWSAVNDSWQYSVACQAVCEAVAANKWTSERGKFSTFVYQVARNAIINEWKYQKVRKLPTTDEEFDIIEESEPKLVLDVPYDDIFGNPLSPEALMFKRYIEGESIKEISLELGISRQTFYNRTKSVKDELARHVVKL